MAKAGLVIEPSESETKEELDRFCEAMLRIAREVEQDAAFLMRAPVSKPVLRLDEVRAACKPRLRWEPARRGFPMDTGA